MYTIVAAFLLTLLVGVGNLTLGYAVALYLGRGPKRLRALPAGVAPTARTRTAAPSLAPVGAPLRANAEASSSAPVREVAGSASAAESVALAEEPSSQTHSPAEEACRLATRAMASFHADLERLECALRHATHETSGEALGTCAAELNRAVRRCLKQLNAAAASASQVVRNTADSHAADEPLRRVVESLAAQANAALADLVGIQFAGDEMSQACDCLAKAHEAIVQACHQCRDQFDDPLLELLRYEYGDAEPPEAIPIDAHGSLAARLLLNRTLAEWWQQRQESTAVDREYTVAMFDINGLGRINGQHGLATGERLIAEVFEAIRAAAEVETAARVAGQQFFVLCRDHSPTSLAELAERVRQTVERTRFVAEEAEVRITLSTAVAAVQPGDTGAVVLQRLRAALDEGKRYGRNRTVLCEDECPTPVVPPELGIAERTVQL